MNSTFKIDWAKLWASKTIRSLAVLGVSLILMFGFKMGEDAASAEATKILSYIDYALVILVGGSFTSAAISRVYADGPLTKSVEQVKAEAKLKEQKQIAKAELKQAKTAAKTAAKLAKIQQTHGK